MAHKTIWLLDIDGVLNCTRPGWGEIPRRSSVPYNGIRFRMRWAPTLIERIKDLHQSGLVEIQWCTTWCPAADAVEQAMGLPEFPRALTMDPVPMGHEGQMVKATAARAVLAAGHRLVWTDDDAIPFGFPGEWEIPNTRYLLVQPNERTGLLPEHIETIEKFIGPEL